MKKSCKLQVNIKSKSISTSNKLSKLKTFNAETVLYGNISKVDYHNHTNFTDGKNTVEECVIKAIDKGLTTIGFSEHVSKNEEWMKEWFARYLEDIEMCKKKYTEIDILCGIEAKINDDNGNLNVDEKYIETVDYVIGVLHTYPKFKSNKDVKLKLLNKKQLVDIEELYNLSVLKNSNVDIIGHVGAIYKRFSRYGDLPLNAFENIIEMAGKVDIAFELSGRYHQGLTLPLLNLCTKHNTKVSFGSDAHHLKDIGLIIDVLKREL